MIHYSTRATLLTLLGALVGCSGYDESQQQELDDGDLGLARSAIINGTELSYNRTGTVALFRMDPDNDNNWRFRGSARVLNPHDYVKFVLTARHCVTTDGTIDGPLISTAADRLVTAVIDPGLYPSDISDHYQRGVGSVVDHPTADAALFVLRGDLGFTNQDPVGLNPLPLSELIGEELRHYGYGFGVASDYDTLGRYRRGTGFELLGVDDSDDEYQYRNPSNGVQVINGDSGGPGIYRAAPTGADYVHYQTGIHSTITTSSGYDVDLEQIWDWLSEQLGYYFLRSAQYSERRVYWDEAVSRELLTTVPNTSGDVRSMLIYHKDTKTIEVLNGSGLSNKCIDLQWNNTANGTPFWLWTCSGGSAQRFVPTVDYQLEMEGHAGKCLEETSDHNLVVAACENKASQTWLFDFDPGDY